MSSELHHHLVSVVHLSRHLLLLAGKPIYSLLNLCHISNWTNNISQTPNNIVACSNLLVSLANTDISGRWLNNYNRSDWHTFYWQSNRSKRYSVSRCFLIFLLLVFQNEHFNITNQLLYNSKFYKDDLDVKANKVNFKCPNSYLVCMTASLAFQFS